MKLAVNPTRDGEEWHRDFGGHKLRTTQRCDQEGRMVERFIGVEIAFRVVEQEGGLLYLQVRAALAAGPVRIPLPRWLAPVVAARERPVADGVQVAVSVTLPWLGLLIAYEGKLHL